MADPRSKVNESKQAYWQAQMRRWQASGQSIRAFCASSNLSEARFSWWRRTLRKRGLLPEESLLVGQGQREGRSKANRPKPTKTFIPIQINHRASAVDPEGIDPDRIEVLLGTGHRLWVGRSVTPASLATVVSVLEGR